MRHKLNYDALSNLMRQRLLIEILRESMQMPEPAQVLAAEGAPLLFCSF
jgi:hypothetical protein